MRRFAQVSLVFAVMIPALSWFIPFINLFGFMVAGLFLLPVLWYFIFERHREAPSDDLLLRLDAIANAIREGRDIASIAPRPH